MDTLYAAPVALTYSFHLFRYWTPLILFTYSLKWRAMADSSEMLSLLDFYGKLNTWKWIFKAETFFFNRFDEVISINLF